MRLAHTHILRNIVEVCAIVIAGAWAFYVFAYQNVIVPSLAPPNPTFSVQMRHVGNDGSFAVVRIDETIRNIGSVNVSFLGHAITVLGMNVVPLTSGVEPPTIRGELFEYSRFTDSKVVYRNFIVTQQGDPKLGSGMSLEPGQVVELSREFYVPRNRFGRLVAWVVAGYTKSSRTIPTTMRISQSGVLDFDFSGDDVFAVRQAVAQLDLKAE